jgi:molecular chaperone DnaK (HSP70)
VTVTFSINSNGILEVHADIKESGVSKKLVIDQNKVHLPSAVNNLNKGTLEN